VKPVISERVPLSKRRRDEADDQPAGQGQGRHLPEA